MADILKQRNILIEQTMRDAELESLLHSLGSEIERQRAMIRAMAYGAIATAFFFFLFGITARSVFI